MKPTPIALAAMLLFVGTAQAQVAADCAAITAAAPATVGLPTALAPVSVEMMAPRHQLGTPTGMLAQAFDESLAVDQVLYRHKLAGCVTLASVTLPTVPGALPAAPASALPVVPGAAGVPASIDPAAYVPRTEFDNAPWRFDMNQNGKRMTADEFTAWMEAKGVRVVKPRVQAAAVSTDGSVLAPEGVTLPVTPPDEGESPPGQ